MGGDLTSDEIGVIRGALDLTSKTARSECTPLDKVPLRRVHINSTPSYAKPTEARHETSCQHCNIWSQLDILAGLYVIC